MAAKLMFKRMSDVRMEDRKVFTSHMSDNGIAWMHGVVIHITQIEPSACICLGQIRSNMDL